MSIYDLEPQRGWYSPYSMSRFDPQNTLSRRSSGVSMSAESRSQMVELLSKAGMWWLLEAVVIAVLHSPAGAASDDDDDSGDG